MSSILNKSLRVLLCCVLCVCICLSLTACTRNTKNISDVDQICVTGAVYESWMYVVADETFVAEMVEIYNGLKYEKTDTQNDMSTEGECYSFAFNNGNETLAKFIVDKSGNFSFEPGGQAYHITSDFDFEHIKDLVDEYVGKIATDTTEE